MVPGRVLKKLLLGTALALAFPASAQAFEATATIGPNPLNPERAVLTVTVTDYREGDQSHRVRFDMDLTLSCRNRAGKFTGAKRIVTNAVDLTGVGTNEVNPVGTLVRTEGHLVEYHPELLPCPGKQVGARERITFHVTVSDAFESHVFDFVWPPNAPARRHA
jgi:hypothetical protein